MLTAKQLDQFETKNVKYFLYDIYAKEMNWVPPSPNPSSWEVKESPEGKYFIDRFDPVSQWFGVYEGFSFIACGRILLPLEKKLEVELYHPIPDRYKVRFYKLAEINRIAVQKECLSTKALMALSLEFMKYFIQEKLDYVFAAAYNPEMIDFCSSIGFKSMDPPVKFKYFESDKDDVNLMCLDCTDHMRIKSIIHSIQKETQID